MQVLFSKRDGASVDTDARNQCTQKVAEVEVK
jgi:hypothetical protein